MVKQHLLGQTAEEADWLIGADLLAEAVRHGWSEVGVDLTPEEQ